MFGKYTKAILGGLAALATWGVTAGADGTYSQVEFWGLLGVVVAALTVAGASNTDSAEDDGGYGLVQVLVVIALLLVILFLGSLMFDVSFRG